MLSEVRTRHFNLFQNPDKKNLFTANYRSAIFGVASHSISFNWEPVMRFLFGSMLVATVGLTSLASPVQASMLYAEPGSDSFSFRYGSGSMGTVILDGFRTLDGKNFYLDESSPSLNGRATFSDVFSVVGGNGEARGTTSSNPSNNSAGIGFGGGNIFGGGKENSNFSFDGGKGSRSFGGVSLRGSDPLASVLTSMGDNRLDDRGRGVEKADVSATPLPATWTMMLIGLGCFGLVMQRLRKKTEKVGAVA
jgi:PEP-CTERM motif-containing protein